jgi:hypothetical protein
MFDKLFKPKSLDQFENEPQSEPEIKVEEPSTENPVGSEHGYVAEITVRYDRAAISAERKYEAKIMIYRNTSAEYRRRYPRDDTKKYVTTLLAAGPNEDLASENAARRAKRWIAEQQIIDKPKKFTLDL